MLSSPFFRQGTPAGLHPPHEEGGVIPSLLEGPEDTTPTASEGAMRVYNLTKKPLDYRGKMLPPEGGSLEYPELDVFVPNRDRELETKRMISFGSLPLWWVREHEPAPAPQIPVALKVLTTDDLAPVEERRAKKSMR